MKRKLYLKTLYQAASSMKWYEFEAWIAKELYDSPSTVDSSHLTENLFLFDENKINRQDSAIHDRCTVLDSENVVNGEALPNTEQSLDSEPLDSKEEKRKVCICEQIKDWGLMNMGGGYCFDCGRIL